MSSRFKHQWERLLRSAATVEKQSPAVAVEVPEARWLLRQREQQVLSLRSFTLRPVLQGGVAVACLLLLLAFYVNGRQIDRLNQDLFAGPEAALTRLVTP